MFNDTTLDLGTFKALADCTGDAVLKRKHKDAIPFNSELLVMITNHLFLEVWPKLKTNVNDLEAVRRRVDMWCKYTKALKPFSGFTSIRFRLQNGENSKDPIVEWLFYPMHGSVTFEDCILTCLGKGGLLKYLVNEPYFESGSVYAPDYDLIPKAEIQVN